MSVWIDRRTRVGFKRKTQYSFRVKGSNFEVLAVSSETYNNLEDCAKAASLVTGSAIKPVLGAVRIER